MKENRLPKEFYTRETHTVARDLLGKIIMRKLSGTVLSARITEVECYIGENDAACHASRGRTNRTEIMYAAGGYAYVYLIYGMYDCLNVVTAQEHFPAAVLIRAGEPLTGIPTMQRQRHTAGLQNLTTGPGKLTQALAITRSLNKEDLSASPRLYIVDDGYAVSPRAIARSPRVGVAYAGADALLPWRYYLKKSSFVSRVNPSYSKPANLYSK